MNLSVLFPGVLDVLVRRNPESTPMLPTTIIGSTRIVTVVWAAESKPPHNQPPFSVQHPASNYLTEALTILFSSLLHLQLHAGMKLNGHSLGDHKNLKCHVCCELRFVCVIFNTFDFSILTCTEYVQEL